MSSIQVGDQRVPIEGKPRFDQNDNWSKGALMRTDEAKRAAAVATGEMVQSLVTGTQSRVTAENGARVLAELTDGLGIPTEPASGLVLPAGVEIEQPTEPEPAEPLALDYELPADVAELLGEPDEPEFDDVDETPEEPAAAAPDADEEQYVDPEVAKLRKQVAAAERKAEHERSLRVQTARGSWEDEARRVFQIGGKPLLSDAELAGITADSHKGFLREAKAIADRNKEIAQRFVTQPVPERRPAAHDPEVWGAPTVGDPTAPADSVAQQRKLQSARQSGRLSNVLKAMIYPDS